MDYGTGAIMAVPGHDERDFAFAQAFGLPIVQVVAPDWRRHRRRIRRSPRPYTGTGRLVRSGAFDGLTMEEGKRRIVELARRARLGDTRGELPASTTGASRGSGTGGRRFPSSTAMRCGTVPVPAADLPVLLPFIADFKPDDSGVSPLARHEEWYRVPCPRCGGPGRAARPTCRTRFSTAPGISCAIRARTAPTSPSTRRSRSGGCRWIPTSAATSTPCCICSTRDS